MIKPPNPGSLAEKGQIGWPHRSLRNSLILEQWMAEVDDDVPLAAMSIPGTHDSAAYTSTWPFVSTQNLSIPEQLDLGIRYFDFRCGAVKDALEMVHGTAKLGLRLDEVLTAVYQWLDGHPTEALIVQLKQDRKTEDCTRSFHELVVEALSANIKYWRLHPDNMKLGEVRGKIQLFRRYTGSRTWAYGIDVTRWRDNSEVPFVIHTWHHVRLVIQDHYSFSDPEPLSSLIAKKGRDVGEMLQRAIIDQDPFQWYINFVSAFEFNVYYQITPRQIALGGYSLFRWIDGMNVRLNGTLQTMGPGRRRFGILVLDFPEQPAPELVKNIVLSNFIPEEPRSARRSLLRALLVVLMLLLLVTICSVYTKQFQWAFASPVILRLRMQYSPLT